MTNLIATISLSLVTNWTGHISDQKELGYIATNHAVTVVYEGSTNEFHLKQVPSEIALWRLRQKITATNIFFESNQFIISNKIHRYIIQD